MTQPSAVMLSGTGPEQHHFTQLDYQHLPDIGLSPETKTVNRDLIVVDANAMVWEERFNEKIGRALYRKNLIEDPDTGMEIRLVRYPAGVINPLHTHPCAHGMFVLEGTLVTHDGTYGPGHFVWFPEGTIMEHGAGAEGDVTVLFITNKPFEIHYQ
jgi:quercetin dioxygenase-like cupin family protein